MGFRVPSRKTIEVAGFLVLLAVAIFSAYSYYALLSQADFNAQIANAKQEGITQGINSCVIQLNQEFGKVGYITVPMILDTNKLQDTQFITVQQCQTLCKQAVEQ